MKPGDTQRELHASRGGINVSGKVTFRETQRQNLVVTDMRKCSPQRRREGAENRGALSDHQVRLYLRVVMTEAHRQLA